MRAHREGDTAELRKIQAQPRAMAGKLIQKRNDELRREGSEKWISN